MSCQECEDGNDQWSESDIFRPGESVVFGPFTNPNSNLYWYDEDDEIYYLAQHCQRRMHQLIGSGLTFYNLEWETPPGGGSGTLSMKVRYDDPEAEGEWALPNGMKLEGRVQIVGDVQVPAGRRVEIADGTTIVFAADSDLFEAGKDVGKVEFLTKGETDVAGTLGQQALFTSSRDPSFTHYLGSGENGESPAAGDYYGLRFNLQGCGCGYGFGTPSKIEHATIRDAVRGISIENFLAPNLKAITFPDGSNTWDIFADSTDVVIPRAYWTGSTCYSGSLVETPGYMELAGPTRFGVANGTREGQDLGCIGEEGKVDIYGDGRLVTTGAEGDSVYFRPETITLDGEDAGANWGGFFISLNVTII